MANIQEFQNGETKSSVKGKINASLRSLNEAKLEKSQLGEIADDVTIAQIGDQLSVKDGGITTSKYANSSVIKSKIENVANMKVLGNVSGSAAAPAEVAVLQSGSTAEETDRVLATAGFFKSKNQVLKTSFNETGTITATTSWIPYDTTVPLISEGDEIFSVSFTPVSATSTIVIEFFAYCMGTTATAGNTIALFAGNTCVGAHPFRQPANGLAPIGITFIHRPLSANAITYTVRAGTGAGTLTIGSNLFDGLVKTRLIITEFK